MDMLLKIYEHNDLLKFSSSTGQTPTPTYHRQSWPTTFTLTTRGVEAAVAAVEVAADPQWGEGPHQLRASFQAQPRLPQTMCSTITSGVLRSHFQMLFSLKKTQDLQSRGDGFFYRLIFVKPVNRRFVFLSCCWDQVFIKFLNS